MTTLIDLPPELGIRIANHLTSADAVSLACTCHDLVDIGESRAWASINVSGTDWLRKDDERTVRGVTAAWRRASDSLLIRSSRGSFIRSLSCQLSANSISSLLDVLAPPSMITFLDIDCIFVTPATRWRSSVIKRLAQGPSLPHLTHLKVRDRMANQNDVYRCLSKMSNLVSLKLDLARIEPSGQSLHAWVHSWLGTGKEDHYRQRTDLSALSSVSLPRIRSFSFTSVLWLNIVGTVIDCAPELDILRILCNGAGDPYGVYSLDANEAQVRDEAAARILRCSTIQSFDADDGLVQYIYDEAPVPLPADWMPNLKRMTSWGLVSTITPRDQYSPETASSDGHCLGCAHLQPIPGHLPKHDRLEWLIFWDSTDQDLTHLCGTFPSSTVTGKLATWMVSALPDLPSLTRMEIRLNWSPYDQGELESTWESLETTGFQFMVFCSEQAETLYHARIEEATETEDILLAHHCRFRAADDLGPVSSVHFDEEEPLDSDDPEADQSEGRLELTRYGHQALPESLLKWVYEEAKMDWDWSGGGRQRTLPDHVWEFLRLWHVEAENMG